MSADKFQKSEAVSLVPAALTAASEKTGVAHGAQGDPATACCTFMKQVTPGSTAGGKQ